VRLLKHDWKLDDTAEDDELYFLRLANGECLGYHRDLEEFSYKNYWNSIETMEAMRLIHRIGVDK
jgi:hypothetical protein